MPTEGFIKFEELGWEFGSSMTEESMIFYTEEEKEFLLDFRTYCKEVLLPKAAKYYAETPTSYEEALRIYREIPKKYRMKWVSTDLGGGGKENNPMFHNIFTEELIAVSYDISNVGGVRESMLVLEPFLTNEQREKWLKPVAADQMDSADALTEPTSGSDFYGGMRTRAERDGDDYVINGEKTWVTSASQVDVLAVYCITNPKVHPHEGMSVIIVPTDTPGFSWIEDFQLLGRRGTRLSHVKFENCRVPKENLVGEENKAKKVFDRRQDLIRTRCAFRSVGIARSALEIATKFAAERMRFGRPIRQFEGVSFKLAEMHTKNECMRLLGIKSTRMYEKYGHATKEAAAAKFYASDTAPSICSEALWILGAVGYTDKYPLERYLREAMVEPISEGTSNIMKFLFQREMYRELGY